MRRTVHLAAVATGCSPAGVPSPQGWLVPALAGSLFGSVSLALAACDGGAAVPGHDAAPSPDVPLDAAACTPLATCDWLDAYQQKIVRTLGGVVEVLPGEYLQHRASPTEREWTRQFLRDELTALGYTPSLHTYATGANVIARLDATAGTGGLIVVGAHLDSVPAGPGAADNATGCAMVLAIARYLRDVPMRSHPVVFALFDEEEIGLVGSRAYAQTLVDGQVDVEAAHVFDMLSFDGDGDRAVELWSPTAPLMALYQHHGQIAAMPIQPVDFDRSDHKAFLERGFDAVGIGEEFTTGDHTPHYHKATDTVDRVSFAHLATVTHLAMAVLEASVTTP